MTLVVDHWVELYLRYQDELKDPVTLGLREEYFREWAKRNITLSTRDRIKWNYGYDIDKKVEIATKYGQVD